MNALDGAVDLSRRDFLKLAGLGMIGALLPFAIAQPARAQSSDSLGRVISDTLQLYDKPSLKAKPTQVVFKDHVLPITDVIVGDGDPPYNRIWYELNGLGYGHSGSVQPVRISTNDPAASIPASGQVGEITVPYTDVRKSLEGEIYNSYRLYYGTTYWIVSSVSDAEGNPWYGYLDDRLKSVLYVQAKHVRLIPPGELATLSADVPPSQKRLEVYLQHQAVIAYENDRAVFMARAATGAKFADGNHSTDPGKYIINRKSPTRHMASGDRVAVGGFDLPGVPWVSFFTEDGISFHGTYWHNDFGKPRSHGCVNVSIPAAKWIYRWCLPVVPPDQVYLFEPVGTPVVVI
jgi:lipoprotein-anchoring transpeptidase ErfK/SrfK